VLRSNSLCALVPALAGLTILAALLASPVRASGNAEDAFVFMRDVLRAAYPELSEKHRFMNSSVSQPVDNSWPGPSIVRFEITPFSREQAESEKGEILLDQHTGKRIPPPSNAPLMAGSFWFDRDGHLFQMWAGESDITRSKQNEEFDKFIQSHPEWPDKRDYQELKKAGALYGPGDKEQLARAIHLERFEKVLGHIEIKSIEFSGPVNEEHQGDFATFDWSVRVAVRRPDGSSGTYALVFEPFGGRLTGIYRTDRTRH
jgi:hypothetical protein